MTRILVCGASYVDDDEDFVANSLAEVNKIYGPISCIIHNNHVQALAWQQKMSRKVPIKHAPFTEDWKKDGHLAGSRCRDKMLEARPHYVIVFETPSKEQDPPRKSTDRLSKVEYLAHRAMDLGIPVLFYRPELKIKRNRRRKVVTPFLAQEALASAAALA